MTNHHCWTKAGQCVTFDRYVDAKGHPWEPPAKERP